MVAWEQRAGVGTEGALGQRPRRLRCRVVAGCVHARWWCGQPRAHAALMLWCALPVQQEAKFPNVLSAPADEATTQQVAPLACAPAPGLLRPRPLRPALCGAAVCGGGKACRWHAARQLPLASAVPRRGSSFCDLSAILPHAQPKEEATPRHGARNTLAARSFVDHIDEQDRFLASPSILELPSGRLLVLFEK